MTSNAKYYTTIANFSVGYWWENIVGTSFNWTAAEDVGRIHLDYEERLFSEEAEDE